MAAPIREHDEHRRRPSTISQKVLNHRKMRRRMKRNDQRFLTWDISGILREGEETEIDDEDPTTILTILGDSGGLPFAYVRSDEASAQDGGSLRKAA